MGYAAVYRKRMNIWRRMTRWGAYAIVFGVLLYFSLSLLASHTGLMMGGTIGGAVQPAAATTE